MPVSLPNIDPTRELARRVLDACVEQVPFVGGPAVAVWSVTHPSEAERKLAKWVDSITGAVNEIEAALDDLVPTIRLSPGASALALWISQNSEQGRPHAVDFQRLVEAFNGATKRELEDACGELSSYALAIVSSAIGYPVRVVSPTARLFEIFDPIGTGDDPRRDAAELARILVDREYAPGADDLVRELGWSVRRFNPAMLIVASFVGACRRSREVHHEFECPYLMPDATERALLRRFSDAVLSRSGPA